MICLLLSLALLAVGVVRVNLATDPVTAYTGLYCVQVGAGGAIISFVLMALSV